MGVKMSKPVWIFNANDAKELTENALDISLKNVYEEIEKEAKAGKTSISCGFLTQAQQKKLRQHGYTVTWSSLDKTIITWY